MNLFKAIHKAPEVTQIDAALAKDFAKGSYMIGKLHSFIPTAKENGFMLEIHLVDGQKTYSVLTYAKKSAAYLTTKLGGKIGLTFRGIEGEYANFSPKFLANFDSEE